MRRSLRVLSAVIAAGLISSPFAAQASQPHLGGGHQVAPALDIADKVFITGQVTWQGKGVDDITVAAYGSGKSPVASAITYAGATASHGGFALLVLPGSSYKLVISGGGTYQDVTKTVSAGLAGGSVDVALTKVLSNKTLPSIVGKKPAVGAKLTVNAGTWTAATPTFTYQWFSNGKPLKKATTTSYKVAATDAGKKLTVKVSATADGYTSATATSPAVTVAKPKPVKKKKH